MVNESLVEDKKEIRLDMLECFSSLPKTRHLEEAAGTHSFQLQDLGEATPAAVLQQTNQLG